MTMTERIPQAGPPERTATAAELADHAARMERARTGQLLPRTLHALCEQAAIRVPCGQCWFAPGTPCASDASGPGYHLARFARGRRRGLITEAELAAVLDEAGVITLATIVRDAR